MVLNARPDLRHEEQVFTFPEDASRLDEDSPYHEEKSRSEQQGGNNNTNRVKITTITSSSSSAGISSLDSLIQINLWRSLNHRLDHQVLNLISPNPKVDRQVLPVRANDRSGALVRSVGPFVKSNIHIYGSSVIVYSR